MEHAVYERTRSGEKPQELRDQTRTLLVRFKPRLWAHITPTPPPI